MRESTRERDVSRAPYADMEDRPVQASEGEGTTFPN
jgi:hypothetical protein